jgi:cytoskeletal protein RodZ
MTLSQFSKPLWISLLVMFAAIACRPDANSSSVSSASPAATPNPPTGSTSTPSPTPSSPTATPTAQASPNSSTTSPSPTAAPPQTAPPKPSPNSPSANAPQPEVTAYQQPIDNAANGAAFIKFIYDNNQKSVLLNSELSPSVTTGEDWFVVFSDCNLSQGQAPSIEACGQGINFKLETAGKPAWEMVDGKKMLKGVWRVETLPGMNQGFLSVKLGRVK